METDYEYVAAHNEYFHKEVPHKKPEDYDTWFAF
jgi:hypothetical protein